MNAKTKEFELVIDNSAFMVEIAIARHADTVSDITEQWAAEQRAQSLNS
jgi:hypothetical protein